MQKTSRIIALLLVPALTGCVSTKQPPAATHDRQNLLHAIEGTKLTNLIRRLHNLTFERRLTEPEMDSQRRQASSLVLEVADGAENIVDCIVAVKPELNLDTDKQQMVRSLTDKLRDEAKTLRSRNQIYQLDDIPATLKQMDATCTACHELFHISTVPAS